MRQRSRRRPTRGCRRSPTTAAHAQSETADLRQQMAMRDEQLEELEDQRRAADVARAAAEAAETGAGGYRSAVHRAGRAATAVAS